MFLAHETLSREPVVLFGRSMAKSSGDSEAFKEASSYISKVQDLLAQEQDKARSERAKLERDYPRIQEFQGKIKLNVGGKIFVTTIQTLTKDPDSMLASMFSGRFPMTPDEDGSFFIDRDPKYFRFILNFLRTGVALLPETSLGRKELQLEAEFYNVNAFSVKVRETFLDGCTLLNGEQQATLADWLGGMARTSRQIYKATRDGFSVKNIHLCCDEKGETVTVMRTTTGYLFGGYTDVSWSSDDREQWKTGFLSSSVSWSSDNSNSWKTSSLSFVFAFTSSGLGNRPLKLNLSGVNNCNAVNHGSSLALWFGNSGAMGVLDRSPSGLQGHSNFNSGHTYQFPPDVTDNFWLAGEEKFQLLEIEVFALAHQQK